MSARGDLKSPGSFFKLRKKLPEGRTLKQIQNHYIVEKALAQKLKQSTRGERTKLYSIMYDELFSKVPDHPRLVHRSDSAAAQARNAAKFLVVQKYINKSTIFAEFAPGDCAFSLYMCRHVKQVYAIDISDQSTPKAPIPDNFKLILYDGYHLATEKRSLDVVFSDQFIEHLCLDDVEYHFRLVKDILKPGGLYIFRTPHAFWGPHDISAFFSDEPEGFHIKEWTYRELADVLRSTGYGSWSACRRIHGQYQEVSLRRLIGSEALLRGLPKNLRRFLVRAFVPKQLCMIGIA